MLNNKKRIQKTEYLSIQEPELALKVLELEKFKRTKYYFTLLQGKAVDIAKLNDNQLDKLIKELKEEVKYRELD